MASGLAIQVQQVERVEHYLMTWMGTPMLERLERWTALHVQRHDFAVHDRLVGIQPLAPAAIPRYIPVRSLFFLERISTRPWSLLAPRRRRPGDWKPGNLEIWESARCGVRCLCAPAVCPECPRGAHSGGGHELSMGQRRASLAARGSEQG